MKIYYRISDNSYQKTKLFGIDKKFCLNNALQIFCGENVEIIADNCQEETLIYLQNLDVPLTITQNGNAGSLIFTIEKSILECEKHELVYFCEDDYLHLSQAPQLLREGIKHSDYVSLYDHPDKYTRKYNGGEISKVIKTASSHWRYTASTCMTFGTKVGRLEQDLDIWKEFTSGNHPHDHNIFTKLAKEKNRRLAVCIPGVACHTDLTVSTEMRMVLIDDWAVQMAIGYLESQMTSEQINMVAEKDSWDKLIAMQAIMALD